MVNQKWKKCCKLPLARSNAGVCEFDGNLYCIGGWNGQSGIRQCEIYNPVTDKWTAIAPLKTGRYQVGVAAFNQKLWAVGGSDAWNCLASVELYDPSINQWTLAAPLLTPRRGCGLAEFNSKLYAVGGSDGSHSLSSTEIYDEDSSTWIVGPNLTTPRSNVSVIVVKDKLYAIGGFSGKQFLNTIEYLDPNMNEWTTFVPQQNPDIEKIVEALSIVEKNGHVYNGHYDKILSSDDEHANASEEEVSSINSEHNDINALLLNKHKSTLKIEHHPNFFNHTTTTSKDKELIAKDNDATVKICES